MVLLVPERAAEGFSFTGWGSGVRRFDVRSQHSQASAKRLAKRPQSVRKASASVRECRILLLVGD